MSTRKLLISALFLSSAAFANLKGVVVPLDDVIVNHPDVLGSSNKAQIDISKIQVSNTKWLIQCDFKIDGNEALSAIKITSSDSGYYSNSAAVFIDAEKYSNLGISQKSGVMSWGPVSISTSTTATLTIENFDMENDISFTQCKATWAPN